MSTHFKAVILLYDNGKNDGVKSNKSLLMTNPQRVVTPLVLVHSTELFFSIFWFLGPATLLFWFTHHSQQKQLSYIHCLTETAD